MRFIMKIFDWYVFRNLFIASAFIAVTLAIIVLLTQSLRFLELVIESGATASSFWLLTLLALPRFFEVILPLALMAGTLFTYNRMAGDAELTAIRATGASPASLAWPALLLALLTSLLLWAIVMVIAPKSLASMQELRQYVKTQISASLFREGVFNQVGPGLTLYIKGRSSDGELSGLMIHDTRDENANPSTIIAKRGMIVNEDGSYKVLVFQGSRQEYDSEREILSRLDFERYSIDLPDSNPVSSRLQEPDERTIFELLHPDETNIYDRENSRELNIEIHRRIVGPLLAPLFTLIACIALMRGGAERRGYSRRMGLAVLSVTIIQSLYLAALSAAQDSDLGLVLLYGVVIIPLILCSFILSSRSENWLTRFYRQAGRAT
jgi:lipopolysaccharide export system permease protein